MKDREPLKSVIINFHFCHYFFKEASERIRINNVTYLDLVWLGGFVEVLCFIGIKLQKLCILMGFLVLHILMHFFFITAEGVCYAKKDYNLAKHPEIDVPNLQAIKLMQSFKSKGYVRETFAWMHYYWYLTNDGIEHLRTYLNLPSEIVPATLKKSAKPPGRPFGGPQGDRPR